MSMEKLEKQIQEERKVAAKYRLLLSLLPEEEAQEYLYMLKKAQHDKNKAKKSFPIFDEVIAEKLKVYTVTDQEEVKGKDLTNYDAVIFDCDVIKMNDFSKCPPNMIFNGDVNLSYMYVKELPDLSNSVVLGKFDCSGNYLKDLKGSPKAVFGNFYCSEQHDKKFDDFGHFKSLKGAPKDVWGCFYGYHVRINSFEGLSDHIEIGPCFDPDQMYGFADYHNRRKKELIQKRKEEYRNNSKLYKLFSRIFKKSR